MKINGNVISDAFGRLHIQNDAVAIAESIKNSIDANAKIITVDLRSYKDKILIIDDGDGLSHDALLEEWNNVGNPGKKDQVSALGGKGIGRFSLFRLGNCMTIYSKEENEQCHKLELKASVIEDVDDLSDFDVKAEAVDDSEWNKLTKNKKGTIVLMTEITDKIYLKVIEKGLRNLQNPLSTERVNVKILYPKEYTETIFWDVKQSVNYAPFKVSAIFEDGKFTAVDLETSLLGKEYYRKKLDTAEMNDLLVSKLSNEDEGYDIPISLTKEIGTVSIEVYNFIFDNKLKQKFSLPENELKERFLSANMGVNIFRNNIKIFGHGNEDFLKLAEDRLRRTDKSIDNKFTFGVVEIENSTKNLLIEQTNREGFIQNDASRLLTIIIKLITDRVGLLRLETKPLLTNSQEQKNLTLSLGKEKTKIIQNHLNYDELKNIIEGRVKEVTSKKFELSIDHSEFNEFALGKQSITAKIKFEDKKEENVIFEVSKKIKPTRKNEAILNIDFDKISKLETIHPKLATLLEEISMVNIFDYPNTVALLLRTIIEISSNEYIISFNNTYQSNKVSAYYDYQKEQLVKSKGDKEASSKDRTFYLLQAIERENPRFAKSGLNEVIISFIDQANFTTHKQSHVMSAKIIKDFFTSFSDTFDHMLDFIINNR